MLDSKEASKRVIAIIDPLCICEIGHNYPAAIRYATYIAGQGAKPILLCSRLTEQKTRSSHQFEAIYCFSHYYGASVFQKIATNDPLSRKLATEAKQGSDILHKQVACKELVEVLKTLGKYEKLSLFYPSIDFYSLYALVIALQAGLLRDIENIYIRWIGVMEHCQYGQYKTDRLSNLYGKLKLLNRGPNRSSRIFHSTECERHAQDLFTHLDQDVIVTPTLLHESPLELCEESFGLAFPGSPRLDKGYHRIPLILNLLKEHDPQITYTAYYQLPISLGSEATNYATKMLIANPHTRAYPHSVSQQILTSYIQASTIVVMPYSQDVYSMRSSAMLAEAACYERQVVGSANCGFSEQIERYGLGICCNDNIEFAKAIHRYYKYSFSELKEKAARARRLFLEYSRSSYNTFFALQ